MGYRNTLSKKLVDRIAAEKKHKLTLNQELEIIKDKFLQMEKVMLRLELDESLEKSALFI